MYKTSYLKLSTIFIPTGAGTVLKVRLRLRTKKLGSGSAAFLLSQLTDRGLLKNGQNVQKINYLNNTGIKFLIIKNLKTEIQI